LEFSDICKLKSVCNRREVSVFAHLRAATMILLLLTALTGFVYPVVVTGIAQLVFPHQAKGSLIVKDGKAVGSELIGQPFDDPKYFWGRPSATGPFPYNAGASSGSNLGPTNPDLLKAVADRAETLKKADPGNTAPVPVDLVTASGSGLDPHITRAAALYQVSRVSKARGIPEERLRQLIGEHTQGRQFGILGEPGVNVLKLNLSLDGN
jgi:K+-transporting ATPase ATPase C chain